MRVISGNGILHATVIVVLIAIVGAGIASGAFYASQNSLHLPVIDSVTAFLSDRVARMISSHGDFGEQAAKEVETALGLGKSFRGGQTRLLLLSIPELARWEESDGYEQLLQYADYLPRWTLSDQYSASSFRLSESYGAFLAALDGKTAEDLEPSLAIVKKFDELYRRSAEPNAGTGRKQFKVREPLSALKRSGSPKDISDAHDEYVNVGNWQASRDPHYEIRDGLKQWLSQPTTQQTILAREIVSSDSSRASGSANQSIAGGPVDYQITCGRFKVFPITQGRWFNREVLRRYSSGSFLKGTPYGRAGYFFGSDGVLAMLPRGIVVAQQTKLTYRFEENDFKVVTAALRQGRKFSLAGLPLAPDAIVQVDEANRIVQVQNRGNAGFIIGIVAEILP